MVAVSRLLLSGSIPHIQIPWTRVGRDAAADPAAAPAATTSAARSSTGACCPRPASSTGSSCRWRMPRRIAARLFRPFRQRTTDYREPPARPAMRPAGRPAGRGRDRRRRLRRPRHGDRAAPRRARRLRRARARGIRRRHLARQHLPRRRVRRALAPLRLRRPPEPALVGHVRARATRSGRYLERVAEREGLGDRLRLRTPLLAAEWDAAAPSGASTTRRRRARRRSTPRSLVLACGRLTEPRDPRRSPASRPSPARCSTRPAGTTPPTSPGARVAVVGTGASAVQLVPELARAAAARHALPAHARLDRAARRRRATPTPSARRFAAHPDELARLRADLYAEGEARFASRSGDAAAPPRPQREARCAPRTRRSPTRALRAALTPGLRVRLQAGAALRRLLPRGRVATR